MVKKKARNNIFKTIVRKSADAKHGHWKMGLVGTMATLVLGLLIASAKEFYDTQSSELTEMSAKVVLRNVHDGTASWA